MQFQFIPQSELSEQCLRTHPVWIAWENPEQDEEISSWGVDVAAAWKKAPPSEDAEYCFPYLGQEPPALVRGVYLAATAHLASGQTLFGYLTGGYAFAVFYCGKTFLFNVNAAIHGKETAEHLGRSLNTAANSIFPIAFEPASSLYKGKEVEYQSFWQEEYNARGDNWVGCGHETELKKSQSQETATRHQISGCEQVAFLVHIGMDERRARRNKRCMLVSGAVLNGALLELEKNNSHIPNLRKLCSKQTNLAFVGGDICELRKELTMCEKHMAVRAHKELLLDLAFCCEFASNHHANLYFFPEVKID
jgi:hypothetical protein